MSSVGRGGQIRLTAFFYEYSGGPSYDPVEGGITPRLNMYLGSTLKSGPHIYSNGTGDVQRDSLGNYPYVFYVPNDTELGSWQAKWDGIIHGTDVIGIEQFEVISAGSVSVGNGELTTLGEDVSFVFSPGATPLYVDPEELFSLFPDASELEIMELIHVYSVEIDNIMKKIPTQAEVTDTMREYIKAATACALSKIYNFGIGSGNESSITLGDLSVTNRTGSKNKVTRGNYSNWCEYAYVLRTELLEMKIGMKAVVKGTAFPNPMPARFIRRMD